MATVPEDMPRLAPDESDVEYGPHERNRFDVYRASSTDPTPVVFFMHGGGFWAGDKLGGLGRMPVSELLEAGLSVVSTNYRFSQHAIYPAPFDDCRRALQFLRHNAANWGLDPTRVAVAGGSAGAGIALWLAFRPDMANPGSDDPVEHQSTRPRCAVTFAGQTSYDPRFMSRLTGGKGHLHPAFAQLFGVEIGVWPELDAEAAQRVEDGAAINFLERDAPPVFCLYSVGNRPTTDEDDYSIGIHHPAFGFYLKTRMEALGRECTVFNDPRMLDDPDVIAESRRQIIEFLGRHLRKACS